MNRIFQIWTEFRRDMNLENTLCRVRLIIVGHIKHHEFTPVEDLARLEILFDTNQGVDGREDRLGPCDVDFFQWSHYKDISRARLDCDKIVRLFGSATASSAFIPATSALGDFLNFARKSIIAGKLEYQSVHD
jgi:hypothetical protein